MRREPQAFRQAVLEPPGEKCHLVATSALTRAVFALALLVSLAVPAVSLAQSGNDLREWHPVNGVQTPLVARPVAVDKAKVAFKTADGKRIRVELSKLPAEERKEALICVVGSGVVSVHTKDTLGEDVGLGSGFIIRMDGMILTNYHVVRGAASVEVRFRDASEPSSAECLAIDRKNDVAVLKVSELPEGAQVLKLAVREKPKAGDELWTIGHPKGLIDTVSWGHVNAVRTTSQLPDAAQSWLDAPKDTRWLQTNAVISQGSSGSPVLNAHGEVLGMTTFLLGPSLGFALRINHAKGAFDEALRGEAIKLPFPPGQGEPALAWPSREVASILRDISNEIPKLQAELADLSPKEQTEKRRQAIEQYRASLRTLYEKDPNSWPGLQAILIAAGLQEIAPGVTPDWQRELCKIMAKHHLDKPDLADFLRSVRGSLSDEATSLCVAAMDTSPHKDVQAQAIGTLAILRLAWLASDEPLELQPIQNARAKVQELAERLAKDYADSPVYDMTATDAASAIFAALASSPVGLPAKDISGVDPLGKTFSLADYRGKVVLLDFFVDWCPWCRKMYEHERELVSSLADRRFALLGVHCESQKVLNDLVERDVVTWRTWADGERGPIAKSWEIKGFPSVYLIDQNGVVRKRFGGSSSAEEFDEAIHTLLGEVEGRE